MSDRRTPQEAATVAGLRASGLSHKAIAERTGIPRRTVTNMLARHPVAEIVTRATEQDVAQKLWEAVQEGTEQVLAGLRDPHAKLGDKAQALRVVAEQWSLLSGRPTARTQNANLNVSPLDATFAAMSDAELHATIALLDAEIARAREADAMPAPPDAGSVAQEAEHGPLV